MPALGGRNVLQVSYRDHTEEMTTHRVYTGEITAVSLPGLLTQIGAYTAATDAITLGQRAKESWGEETVVSNDAPASQAAQRESKLLVQYRGVTTEEPFTLTIGTVDDAQLNFVPGGGDAVIFSGAGASTTIADWVTAFEAIAKNPNDETEAVEVVGMRRVGRAS